jgi:hypothetical protein
MQKVEAHSEQTNSHSAARQAGAFAVASPEAEQVSQLEAMAEDSLQMVAQRKLAAGIYASPVMTAQLKRSGAIHNSPLSLVQRSKQTNQFDPVQRVEEEEEPLQGKFGTIQKVEEEEEPLQGKFEAVQRIEDEEEPLQGKFDTVQRVEEEEEPLQGKFASEPVAQREAASTKPNNTGLPDNLKSGVENLSGMSMDNVKVHYNSSQPAQLNALAYAQGTDIHVAPGQEQHLPHEAWHVVQQAQGRVQPTMQMKGGIPVNDDKGLEHEADVMGSKALSSDVNSHNAVNQFSSVTGEHNSAQLIQRRLMTLD